MVQALLLNVFAMLAYITRAETLHPIGSNQIISHRSYSSDAFIFPFHLQAFDGRRLEEGEKSYHLNGEESFYVFVAVH